MQLIPLSEAAKHRVDFAAVPTALSMPFFTGIPWAEIASFLAAVYAALRLLEWGLSRGIRLREWWKARRSSAGTSQVVDK